MTCHELREALVDHARDALTGAGSRAAMESHLEYCHACALEYARQRALTEGLRAVARASAHESASSTLEGRLMDAFAAQASVVPAPAVRRRLSPWLAAAASIAIVGGLAYGVAGRLKTETTGVPLKLDATGVRLKPDATEEVRLKPDATGDATNTPNTGSARRPPSRPAARPGLKMDDFVTLPGAIGLPSFESGRIVRVDLPVSSLPAYGVELVPDAARNEVQADVLVGQDGQARAIRLVRTSTERSGVRP
jgi:hypothetical protein